MVKRPIARSLRINPKAYTDTHILTLWLIKHLALGKNISDIVREAHQYTKTALNLVIADVMVSEGLTTKLYAYSYISKRVINNEKRLRYYKPVFFRTSHAAGFTSSTIKLLAEDEGLDLGEVVERTEYLLEVSIH